MAFIFPTCFSRSLPFHFVIRSWLLRCKISTLVRCSCLACSVSSQSIVVIMMSSASDRVMSAIALSFFFLHSAGFCCGLTSIPSTTLHKPSPLSSIKFPDNIIVAIEHAHNLLLQVSCHLILCVLVTSLQGFDITEAN
ncbi:hypothetical protein O6H91_07G081500 [Diphasiastrum complanatum]|uniref:Uncharacterized protein n=1 Tax=Diphasiastrum complanatum TaxID=34168 RepID=A0ACC2D7Z3_DIPCM|nr:hypothetical protein O6H91_07G081500 [Diphasiastrum complanatum]